MNRTNELQAEAVPDRARLAQRRVRAAKVEKTGTRMVYFIRCQDFVKIGYSTLPYSRMSTAQSGSPFELEMLAIMLGGPGEERRLHEAFASLRYRAEWFHLKGDLLALVNSLRRLAPLEARDCVEAWFGRKHEKEARSAASIVAAYDAAQSAKATGTAGERP